MSTASRKSWAPSRRSKNSSRDAGRPRTSSRAASRAVDHEEARSFALRSAYLHYLLQPKLKRKQYVAAAAPSKPNHRSQASVGQLISEYGFGGPSTSLKLPHNFAAHLTDRMGGVLRGVEHMPGYNDAAVKRSFAEAYTKFSDKNTRKIIEMDRKFEFLVLMFYTAATKASQKGRAPDDDSWKMLPDRHLAMFVRLVSRVLKDHGHERDRAELISHLQALESKLLTNEQNLVGNGSDTKGKTIEVVVPLSYDVKDMPLVQVVASIFGLSLSDVQNEINENRQVWTEEAALKDLKAYQLRLSSNADGSLTSQDFDLDEAYEEWKKSEAPQLSKMMMELLTANPSLSKMSTNPLDKPLPSRASMSSGYGSDQAYADLSRALSNADSGSMFDPSLGLASLSMTDSSSIRTVEGAIYTYIPPNPRAFYKYILQHAMTYDQLHADPELDYQPLSKQSIALLIELCVRWRIPQFSRLIAVLEIAARKYLDQEIVAAELDAIFDLIKGLQEDTNSAENRFYTPPIKDLEPTQWTMHDMAAYKSSLSTLHDSLLRELYDILEKCYDSKPPKFGAVMTVLETHVKADPSFSPRPEAADEFSAYLTQGLRQRAMVVYQEYMQKEIPAHKEDWDFAHVVQLGKSVTKLCDRIHKRYSNMRDIMGVDPLAILVQEIFPSFEEDANAIIRTIMQEEQTSGVEMATEDGFELYKELVELRRIHRDSLPDRPFAFDVENLLVEFVWRYLQRADGKMTDYVDAAIKQDQFQVRTETPEHLALDSERHSVSIIDLFMLFNQTLNQIFKLEWDNDEHHARFMTALARSFSAGLGNYCEIVEQRFAREMDRPSAEEMAAQTRSPQERWMQYAKDAWNNKEKAEPFQFYAESFVKLNNIEYAMQELDKLEKTMNPEACASLLEAIDGPKKRPKKPSKYTFTIKVVEAEDLKACDPSGFSDPYVVFGDEYQNRLHKTRIIHRNLNPRWDESFDVTVQGPVNIISTIWDYDTFGDHDYVGRTSVKLDPVHFSDYLPREFWLDLDSQGRILIRVSMEGERDDIQFHFGKAFRHLKRTERDMVRKITDKLTTQISETLSQETLRSLLGSGGLAASVAGFLKKRASTMPTTITKDQIEAVLTPLFTYFDENFAIMKQTLTDATMVAVMTRLWKEVLMTIESLLVPPMSEKPSLQRPLSRMELDVVYHWLDMLFVFFNAKDESSGEQLGVKAEVLKSPKWHELASLAFFYFDDTNNLIRESERMAAATAQRAQQSLLQQQNQSHRFSAPASMGASLGGAGAFASMGTIRRGKSIMMSRNLGTMRKAKEAKRAQAQADPSDDMILRILRMRPEATPYLKERHRQKERQAATAAAALIVRNSVNQGWNMGGGGQFGRNNLPRR